MRRKIATGLAWLAATAASIVLASAAVGNVRNEVSDRPATLQASAASATTAAPTATQAPGLSTEAPGVTLTGPATTASAVPTTTAAPGSTSTTEPAAPAASSTTAPETTSSTSQAPPTSPVPTTATSTTSPPTTTTSTTAPPPTSSTSAAPPEYKSYQLVGGWVQLRVAGAEVYLDAAVPSPGFSVRVDDDGPARVEVEFRNDSHESKLHARVSGGELDVEIDEGDDD